jgi:hypothetical protein
MLSPLRYDDVFRDEKQHEDHCAVREFPARGTDSLSVELPSATPLESECQPLKRDGDFVVSEAKWQPKRIECRPG